MECMSNAGSVVYGLYGMLELKLCCEILLLLNMADMDLWKTGVRVPCHLVCINRLSACREYCIVGKMAQCDLFLLLFCVVV